MFILRAINHSRKEFLPTYTGLRFLLASSFGGRMNDFVTSQLRRNALLQKQQAYRRHLIFKNIDTQGNLVYRSALSASPSALLLESYALQMMAEDSAFRHPSSTFSYHWPSARSTQPWRYFYKGWQEREEKIAKLLGSDDDKVAILVDITNFYPSVKGDDCLRHLKSKLAASNIDEDNQKIVVFAAEQSTAAAGDSLPVGPMMGHALANISMSDLDLALGTRFKSSYLRYVDDIAVVVNKTEVSEAYKYIKMIVDDAGLTLNESKTQIVDVDEWASAHPPRSGGPDLGTLRSMITTFLALRPASYEELKTAFLAQGFNLPFKEMRYNSANPSFWAYLRQMPRVNWSRGYLKTALTGTDEIQSYALFLRNHVQKQIEHASATQNLSEYARNKNLRKLVNLIGGSLYLHPLEDLHTLFHSYTQGVDAGAPLNVLLNACRSKNATEILSYPGPTANTFAQLWDNSMQGAAVVDWDKKVHHQQRDAAASLLLRGVIEMSSDIADASDERSEKALFDFCAGRVAARREFQNFSYMDELRCLQLGSAREDTIRFQHGRFDIQEGVPIEGLGIAGSYS